MWAGMAPAVSPFPCPVSMSFMLGFSSPSIQLQIGHTGRGRDATGSLYRSSHEPFSVAVFPSFSPKSKPPGAPPVSECAAAQLRGLVRRLWLRTALCGRQLAAGGLSSEASLPTGKPWSSKHWEEIMGDAMLQASQSGSLRKQTRNDLASNS